MQVTIPTPFQTQLPIRSVLPELAATLQNQTTAVLTAPPGSGKTTCVPLALLNAPWLKGRKILMLEPRRMAARAASWRMAELLGESPGGRVGHVMRLERCLSERTRIVVMTEGLLARRIIDDAELADVGLILFDEFHERSVQADLGLALALDVQRNLRPDLRIVVMSATLDAAPIARHLGGAPILTAAGRLFPVETIFAPRPSTERSAEQVAKGVRRAWAEQTGSILAFLPGEGEIRAALALLEDLVTADVDCIPLYAALPRQEQDRALRPSPPGRRKVVLATSIAESSLTIEGITTVVDSGMARVSRFSTATGMSRLETIRIARDRADQRRGRAGRLGPGVCYRLWRSEEDGQLEPTSKPEILSTDLVPIVLQVADWGVNDRLGLPWLTPPLATAWEQAQGLLKALHAIDSTGCITSHGREMARLGVHPRFAHAMLQVAQHGDAEARLTMCQLAALLSEGGGTWGERETTHLAHRLGAFVRGDRGFGGATRKQMLHLADVWYQMINRQASETGQGESYSVGLLLALAFPDRVALRRIHAEEKGRYRLQNGRGAKLAPDDPLAASEWICVAEIDDQDADAKIRMAAPLTRREVEQQFGDAFQTTEHVEWNARFQRVEAVEQIRFGALVVRERPLQKADATAVMRCLCEGIRQEGLGWLDASKHVRQLQARIQWVSRVLPQEGFPEVSDEQLLATLETWLGDELLGKRSLEDVQKIDFYAALQRMMGGLVHRLDGLVPTQIRVPSGSLIRVDYAAPQPEVSVRLQEVFGLMETPRVLNGRIPILFKLLSPAQRPVQVTSDLANFWREGYREVRKDMRGRYPRHYWPEDPSQATPTRRVRPT